MSEKKTISRGGLITVLIIFAVIIMFVGFATAGFSSWSSDEISNNLSAKPNPNNFYTADTCELEDASYSCGITVDVDEKTGAFVLNGTANADKDIKVGTIVLDEGTYNLTAVKGANVSKAYMTATVGAEVNNFDFTENDGNILNVSKDDTSVVLTLHIAEGTEFDNFKVLPVVVSGEEAQSFYD